VPNPDGKNSAADLKPYGDVKRQTQLTQAAPMSGAPFAGSAVNAARRAQRQAAAGRTGKPAPAGAGSVPLPAAPPPQALPETSPGLGQVAQRAMIWQDLANTPGASPLVQAYAEQAQREAQSG